MKSKTLCSLGALALFYAFQAQAGFDQTHIGCYSVSSSGKVTWDWALVQRGIYFTLGGNWRRTPEGKYVFLTEQNNFHDVGSVCRDTIQGNRGSSYKFLKFVARNSGWGSEYPVKFSDQDVRANLEKIHQDLRRVPDAFLKVAKKWMKSPDYEDVLAQTLVDRVQSNSEDRKKWVNYPVKAERFSARPIQWKSEDPVQRVSEWLEQYRTVPDVVVLSEALNGPKGGLNRGSLNTFTDFVVDSFKPLDLKKDPNATPALFDESKPAHQKTWKASHAFGTMVSLKGILDMIDRITLEADKDSLDDLYQDYVFALEINISSLKDLESVVGNAGIRDEFAEIRNRLQDMNWFLVN